VAEVDDILRGERDDPDADSVALARARDRINRDRFAIRRDLQAMGADERRLEERLADLRASQARAKTLIESMWRTTHFGTEPERRFAWRDPARSVDGRPARREHKRSWSGERRGALGYAA
jgi:hypothetical protein